MPQLAREATTLPFVLVRRAGFFTEALSCATKYILTAALFTENHGPFGD